MRLQALAHRARLAGLARVRLNSLLLRAIQHNNREQVHKYLRRGARADAKDADGHPFVVFAEIHYNRRRRFQKSTLLGGVRTTTKNASAKKNAAEIVALLQAYGAEKARKQVDVGGVIFNVYDPSPTLGDLGGLPLLLGDLPDFLPDLHDGKPFIDRDPKHFGKILEFYHTGTLTIEPPIKPANILTHYDDILKCCRELHREANFYSLHAVCTRIQGEISKAKAHHAHAAHALAKEWWLRITQIVSDMNQLCTTGFSVTFTTGERKVVDNVLYEDVSMDDPEDDPEETKDTVISSLGQAIARREHWCLVLHLNQLKEDDGNAWDSEHDSEDSEFNIDSKTFFELYQEEVGKARNALAELNDTMLFPERAVFGYIVSGPGRDEVYACSLSPDTSDSSDG
jgi:hypothetical protein